MNGKTIVAGFAALALIAGLSSSLAHAEKAPSVSSVMTAEELKTELFGVAMQGVAGPLESRWSECIDPEGDTVYRFDGMEMNGRLAITSNGLACFSYAHMDYQSPVCFKVSRTAQGYTFWGGAEGVFRALDIERGVESCPAKMKPIS